MSILRAIKNIPNYIITKLTIIITGKIDLLQKNRFKTWKLKQPMWKQLLIELPIYLIVLWLLNMIFNQFGYQVTPW